jgi:geranylgeranylglycerol-phosphate geranylgeranyltransferase
MTRLAALASLVRPANLALAAVAIVVGARFSCAPRSAFEALGGAGAVAVAAALLLVAGGYAWNDAADVERDRVAHPRRPVAAGRLAPVAARRAALALLALGAALALAAPSPARALLLAWAPLLLAYRALAARLPASKNVVAAALTASALLLGGLLGPAPARALAPAAFAFALSWIREAVKDLADRDGDRAVGAPTWIDGLPRPSARRLLRAASALVMALIPLPALFMGYGPAYLAVAGLGVGTTLALLYCGIDGVLAARADAPAAASRRLKVSIAAGLLALLASRT